MRDVNFIHETFRENMDDLKYMELLLGPFEDHEENVFFNDSWKMEDIWIHVGLFSSKGQARKNKHGGPIPKGYVDTIFRRKRKIAVTILNIPADF